MRDLQHQRCVRYKKTAAYLILPIEHSSLWFEAEQRLEVLLGP